MTNRTDGRGTRQSIIKAFDAPTDLPEIAYTGFDVVAEFCSAARLMTGCSRYDIRHTLFLSYLGIDHFGAATMVGWRTVCGLTWHRVT